MDGQTNQAGQDNQKEAKVGGKLAGDRDYQQIEQRFNPNPRPITVDQREVLTPIMFAAKDLATSVIEHIPDNRERSIALTHLQEFVWAVEKGILNTTF